MMTATATAPRIEIYGFSGSPYTWRPLIALEEKGLAHERHWIPRASGRHRSPELVALNPRAKLPIVRWDDLTLFESQAICHFIEAERPEPALVPADPRGRAAALVRAAEVAAHAELTLMKPIELGLAPGATGDGDELRAANRAAHAELARWDGYLAAGPTDYLAGASFSLADLVLYPLVAFGVRCGLTLAERTPALARWYDRVTERPSVQASWPPHWRESAGRDLGLDRV